MFRDALLSFEEISPQLIRKQLQRPQAGQQSEAESLSGEYSVKKTPRRILSGRWHSYLRVLKSFVTGSILIICCCMIIIPKFLNLKQQHLSFYSFYDQEFRYSLAASSALGSHTSCNRGVTQAEVSSKGSSGEGAISKLLWFLAGFSSLSVVWLRVSLLSWLLAGGHPPFLAMWPSPVWQLASSK